MMKSTAFVFAALLALPGWAVSSVFAPPAQALKAALQDADPTVTVGANRIGLPGFVQAGTRPLAKAATPDHASRAKAVIAFLQHHADAYRLNDPADELRLMQAQSDALGQHHYLLQQHLHGVPIHGAQAKAHFRGDELHALTTRTVATPHHIDTAAALSVSGARNIVRRLLPSTHVEQREPVLEIRKLDDDYRLTYRVESFAHEINRWQTVLDAHTGAVLRHHLDHHDNEAKASGLDMHDNVQHFTAWQENDRYHMVDVITPVDNNDENPLMRRSSYGDTYIIDFHNTKGDKSSISSSLYASAAWDPLAVSAINHAQLSFHYFRDTHLHSGVDDRNANILVGIHFGDNYDNAFWNGKWLVFGDGGKAFSYLASCLDVVGHEFAHGVIQHTAALVYENQSGALNESFADVFGAMIERRNWTIGEGCTNLRPGYLRNMQDPHKGLSAQPKHMSEYAYLPNTKEGDWGGVHVNSGIPNRAAYLLIEGLSREGLGVSIGAAKAEALYFRALSTYLVSTSEFIDLRRAMLLAADDLYASDSSVNKAVQDAFNAVGIVELQAEKPDSTVPGKLSANVNALDFEQVSVGKSRSLSLRFANAGSTTVTVSDITVTSGFSHSFMPVRVPAGSVMEGSVTFHATAVATVNGTIKIHSDGAEPEVSVALKAIGVSASQQQLSGDAYEIDSGGGATFWLLILLPLLAARTRRS